MQKPVPQTDSRRAVGYVCTVPSAPASSPLSFCVSTCLLSKAYCICHLLQGNSRGFLLYPAPFTDLPISFPSSQAAGRVLGETPQKWNYPVGVGPW